MLNSLENNHETSYLHNRVFPNYLLSPAGGEDEGEGETRGHPHPRPLPDKGEGNQFSWFEGALWAWLIM